MVLAPEYPNRQRELIQNQSSEGSSPSSGTELIQHDLWSAALARPAGNYAIGERQGLCSR